MFKGLPVWDNDSRQGGERNPNLKIMGIPEHKHVLNERKPDYLEIETVT